MGSSRFISMAAAAVLALAAPAHAKILRTAPASDSWANAQLLCETTNVGSTPITVQIESRGYDGALVESTNPYALSGGEASSWAPYNSGGAYCKFIITQGSATKLRAQAVYTQTPLGNRMIAVPAR